MAHGAVGLEAAIQLDEINGPLALMDLDGVPAAQRNVRPTFTGEMDEISFVASSAAWAGLGGRDLGVLVGPEVKRK